MKKLLMTSCLFLAACSSMQAQKANGSAEKTKVEMILHARSGSINLQGGQGTLHLMDANKNISLLSVPPDRKISAALLKQETVQEWDKQFGSSPPNATLFYFVDSEATEVPIKVKSFASDDRGNLTFKVEALESKDQNMTASFDESSLFIDGLTFGSVGFVGY